MILGFWEGEPKNLSRGWIFAARSELENTIGLERFRVLLIKVWKAQSRARARFTWRVSADGSVYCTAWKTGLQISGRPRAGEISRNIRGSDLRAKIACKILTLVFAPRCFHTKFYGAISTTIAHSFRRLEYNRGLEKQDRRMPIGCRGADTRREIAGRDWLGG